MPPKAPFLAFKLIFVAYILYSSLMTAFSPEAANPFIAILAWTEVFAIIALLFPRALLAAGASLFVIFVIAAVITAATGQIPARFAYYIASLLLIVHAERNVLPHLEKRLDAIDVAL